MVAESIVTSQQKTRGCSQSGRMFLSSIWYSNENVDVPDDFLSPRIYREWNNSVLFMLCGPTNTVQESVGFIPFELVYGDIGNYQKYQNYQKRNGLLNPWTWIF